MPFAVACAASSDKEVFDLFSPIDRARIVRENRDGRRMEGRETQSEVQSRPRPHTRGSQHDPYLARRWDGCRDTDARTGASTYLTTMLRDAADADIVVTGPDDNRAPYLSRV